MKSEEKVIKDNTKKVIIRSIAIMLGLVIVLLVATFAFWFVTRTQDSTNVIRTLECLDISLSGNEPIVIEGGIPLTNSDGMNTIPHSFTITNECNEPVEVDIILAILSETDMQAEYVRISLQSGDGTSNNTGLLSHYGLRTPTVLPDSSSRIISSNLILGANQTIHRNLRLWIDANAPFEQTRGTSLYSRIVVVASPRIVPTTTGIVTYTVRFHSNGGTHVATQYVDHEDFATEPSEPIHFSDYIFQGWYVNYDFSGEPWDFRNDRVTSDIDLYARWRNGE